MLSRRIQLLTIAAVVVLAALFPSTAYGDGPGAAGGADAIPGIDIPIYGSDLHTASYIPAPVREVASGAAGGTVAAAAVPNSSFIVNYHDFPEGPKAAFQAAVDVWAALIHSPVPIVIDAVWKDLGAPQIGQSLQLGGAHPFQLYRNGSNAPNRDTWYPVALVNKFAGKDILPNDPDIVATFNGNTGVPWFFGTSGGTSSSKFDFMSVVLHEIGHGLGFLSFDDISDGQGRWDFSDQAGTPGAFSRFEQTLAGKSIIDIASPSTDLATVFTSNNLYFSGPNELAANRGQRAKIYAPSVWSKGHSGSHLDENAYPTGDLNSLMTPDLAFGEAVHDPGPIAVGILRDIGWAAPSSGKLRYIISGLANGSSQVDAAYVGSTASLADAAGQQIQFTVFPAPGSSATPKFDNGQSSITVPVGGSDCDADTDTTMPLATITKCFARARLTSATPGSVDLIARNTTSTEASAVGGARMSFVQPRAIISTRTASTVSVQNAGTADGTFVVDYYSFDGTNIPGARIVRAIPAGGSSNFLGGVPANFSGVVIAGGDQPAAINGILVHANGGGRLATAMDNGFPFTPTVSGETLTLPYVANQLGGAYNTDVTLVNTGLTKACATITYTFVPGSGSVPPAGRAPVIDAGPSGGCSAGFAIPVNGQFLFTPLGGGSATAMPSTTKDALMAATIVITGGSAAASVEAYTTDGTSKGASYEGFVVSATGSGAPQSDLGTNITIPLALKTSEGYYTQILLSNPSAAAASVTITYAGNTGTHKVTLTVPANGVANHSVYADDTVPLGFIGAATVSSSQPVAAVLFRAKKVSPTSDVDEDLYTAVNGVPSTNAVKTIALPYVARRVAKTDSRDGINSWISVSVPGGGTANLTLRSVSTKVTGCQTPDAGTVFTQTKTITGSFVFYQNSDTDNGLGATPDCFSGGTIITSDVPVVAVASYINDLTAGDGEGVYNGIPIATAP